MPTLNDFPLVEIAIVAYLLWLTTDAKKLRAEIKQGRWRVDGSRTMREGWHSWLTRRALRTPRVKRAIRRGGV